MQHDDLSQSIPRAFSFYIHQGDDKTLLFFSEAVSFKNVLRAEICGSFKANINIYAL
jgi:hypothetical protein